MTVSYTENLSVINNDTFALPLIVYGRSTVLYVIHLEIMPSAANSGLTSNGRAGHVLLFLSASASALMRASSLYIGSTFCSVHSATV